MSLIYRASNPNELDKRIDKITSDAMTKTPSEYEKIFKSAQGAAGDYFTESEISGLGPLREIGEGQRVEYDSPEEGNKYTRTYKEFGLGMGITFQAIKDGIFRNLEKAAKSMGKSAITTINTEAFDLFNSGFTTQLAADGQAIFSSHTTLKSGDTIDNALTGADLAETSLQALFEYFDGLVDHAGNKDPLNLKHVVVPIGERFNVMKLWSGDRVLGSNNNDYLTTNPKFGVMSGWQPIVSRYLTDADAFFGLSEDHDFRIAWKEKPYMMMEEDFDTRIKKYQMLTRFLPYCNIYRGVAGNPGA
jgi:hypothetical protein